MTDAFDIRPASVAQPAVRELILLHLRGMHANSPPDHVWALDLSGYEDPSLSLWGAWREEAIAGMIALKRIAPGHGEIKSMRTHPDHLRRGVGRALLAHLVGAAQGLGFKLLSLETGRGAAFEPALALYREHGFTDGPAFSHYEANEFSQFLHMRLG